MRDQLISDEGLHGQKGYYKEVTKNIDVVGPYEVVFNLTRPDGNFIRAHSENEGGFEIRSKKDFEKIGAPTMQTRPLAGAADGRLRIQARNPQSLADQSWLLPKAGVSGKPQVTAGAARIEETATDWRITAQSGKDLQIDYLPTTGISQ